MKGGVWCYDPKTGLYPKYQPSSGKYLIKTIATTDVSTANDTIDIGATIYAKVVTGTPVMYDNAGGTTLAGLADKTVYYIIKSSGSLVKLATSKTNATAGTGVNLTGTGNSSQKLLSYQEQSIAEEELTQFTSVNVVTGGSFADRDRFNRIMVGCISTDSVGTIDEPSVQMLVENIPNVGYLEFPRINSSQVKDKTASVNVAFKPLNTDGKIYLKYKSRDKAGYPILLSETGSGGTLLSGTWTNTTTFTSTYATLSTVIAGEEITFMGGVGAGHIRHISSINESGGTYTIVIDEAIPLVTANDVCRFRVDNYFKHPTTITSSDNNDGTKQFVIGDLTGASKFLQVKLEVRGIKVKVEYIDINGASYQPFKT